MLRNGDRLSGELVAVTDSTLQVRTLVGIAELRCAEVYRVSIAAFHYRLSHHLLWMPSAAPIGRNTFIGMTALAFLHAGVGIGSWLSLAAARTLLPTVPAREQVTLLHLKLSAPESYPFGDLGAVRMGGGIVLGWMNAQNPVHHLYAVATVRRVRSRVSAAVFYRFGGPELFTFRLGNFLQTNVRYGVGTFGIALGVDTQLPASPSLHVLSELWNLNVAKPTQTAFTLGLRFAHYRFTGDFAVAIFPQPVVVPFASLWWTPF